MTVCVRSRAIHCSSRRCQSRSNVRGRRLAVRPGLRCQKGWRFPIRSRLDCAHRRREACGACRTRPTDRPFGQRRRRWWTLIIVARPEHRAWKWRCQRCQQQRPFSSQTVFSLKQFVERRTSTSLASEACVRDFYRTVHVSETGHVEPFLAIKFQVHLTGHCRLSSTDQPVTKFLFVFGSNHHPSTTIMHQEIRRQTPPLSPFTREARAPVSRPRLLVRVYSSFRPAFVCAANNVFGTSVKSHENEAGTKKRIRDLSRGPCTVAPIHTFTHRHHDCAEYLAT